MATSKKTIIIRSEFTPSGLNHNISHYLNRLHLSRAHHFLNQASLQCSCPLGSVVQLEACEQKKEILILTLRPSLCSGYKVCKALRHSSRSRYCNFGFHAQVNQVYRVVLCYYQSWANGCSELLHDVKSQFLSHVTGFTHMLS